VSDGQLDESERMGLLLSVASFVDNDLGPISFG
jgi:hypothetical protein